jgi:hypothetical protein
VSVTPIKKQAKNEEFGKRILNGFCVFELKVRFLHHPFPDTKQVIQLIVHDKLFLED